MAGLRTSEAKAVEAAKKAEREKTSMAKEIKMLRRRSDRLWAENEELELENLRLKKEREAIDGHPGNEEELVEAARLLEEVGALTID